jgi:hypothetical protein
LNGLCKYHLWNLPYVGNNRTVFKGERPPALRLHPHPSKRETLERRCKYDILRNDPDLAEYAREDAHKREVK